MTVMPHALHQHGTALRPFLSRRHDDDQATADLPHLLDEVGTDAQHPLSTRGETLGTLWHVSEEPHHSMPEWRGVDVLHVLMDEPGLTPSDLPAVGSHGVGSDIRRGKRALHIRQIRVLAKRFQVPPSVCIEAHVSGCLPVPWGRAGEEASPTAWDSAPNKGLELTGNSVRSCLAPAIPSSSGLAFA